MKYMQLSRLRHHQGIMAVIVLGIVGLGMLLLLRAHAASGVVSLEPEAGVRSGAVTLVTDATASGGSAIKFGGSVTPTPTPAPTPTPPPPGAGKGIGFSITSYPLPTAAELPVWIADMHSLGITWLRMDFPWHVIQPTNATTYNWSLYDPIVNTAAGSGIKIDAVVDDSPAWNRNASCNAAITSNQQWCPPADNVAYGKFATDVMARYGSKIGSVEIWNEPNIYQFFKPKPDAAAYTAILKAGYTAIKKANPNMPVLNGGISQSYNDTVNHNYIDEFTFLQSMYTDGAQKYMDYVAYHPYDYPQLPSNYTTYNAWSKISQTPTSMRSIMKANGDGTKPIWITEFGAPTGGPDTPAATCATYNQTGRHKVDETLQANILRQAIGYQKLDATMGTLFLYTYKDKGTAQTTQENFFGIVRNDGTHKPSYDVVKKAIAAPAGPVSTACN